MNVVKANGVSNEKILDLIHSGEVQHGLIVRYSPKPNNRLLYETWYIAEGAERYTYGREIVQRPVRIPRQARYFQRNHPIVVTDPGHVKLEALGTDCMAALSNPIHTPRVGRLPEPLDHIC